MEKKLIFRLKSDKNFEIEGMLFCINDNNYSIIYYHVMNGSNCDTIDQVLQGWKEQNQLDNKKWQKLVQKIELDTEKDEKIFNNLDNDIIIIEY